MGEKREKKVVHKKNIVQNNCCVLCGVCGEETVTVVVGWDRYILFFYKKNIPT